MGICLWLLALMHGNGEIIIKISFINGRVKNRKRLAVNQGHINLQYWMKGLHLGIWKLASGLDRLAGRSGWSKCALWSRDPLLNIFLIKLWISCSFPDLFIAFFIIKMRYLKPLMGVRADPVQNCNNFESCSWGAFSRYSQNQRIVLCEGW